MNSKQFLKEGFLEDAHEAHSDHEVQMARVDCYYAAEHAIVLHKLLRNISEEQGLEGWVASKITLANDYLKSVREHLEYQMMNVDAGEDDFLPLAEGLKPVKKNSVVESTAPVAEDEEEKFQDFERGPWYVIVKGNPVSVDGMPKKFNWLNGAKTYFRSMMDKNPEMAQKIKREYDEASDKKSVIYYTKNLPADNTTSTEQPVSESEKPGLWANIRAKRERIKGGSGERMRKPGSKGAPSDKDLKSIRAASESTVNESDFHSQFAAMIDDMKKSGQLKTGGPTKSQAKYAPEPSREELEARLRELESEFDPEYQYSDDYSFWTKQNAIAREIASIKKKLGRQGVAKGFSDVVKGIKRSIKGKEHPDVVASKHAGRAIGHYNQGDIESGDKETKRYVKTRDMHLKAKGVAEGFKNTYNVGDRVDGPLGTGTIVAVSKNINVDGRVKVKLDDPSKAGEDGKYKDSFVLTTTHLKHISEQGVAEGEFDQWGGEIKTPPANWKKGLKQPTSPAKLAKQKAVKRQQKQQGVKQQGVAEGSDQVYRVLAFDKSNALSKQVKLKVKASSLDEVFERLAINDWYPLEINGVEVINGKRLKQGVAEGTDQKQLDQIVSKTDTVLQSSGMKRQGFDVVPDATQTGVRGSITPDALNMVKSNLARAKNISTTAGVKPSPDPVPLKQPWQVTNKDFGVNESKVGEACWKGYRKEGMKTMFGKKYPNCVKNTKKESVSESTDNSVEALIQVYNNRDQKIVKTKVFRSEDEANRWADRNNATILKLKDVAKKSTIDETTAGSIAGVVNPKIKNKSKVGTLFGGTYRQQKDK